jgi:hypothetical protein
VLAQLMISDQRARKIKGILQTFSLPERDVEEGIAVTDVPCRGKSYAFCRFR